ncbi:thiol-disulfide isomerase/thioredoxin [Jejuia pallidilutea]|uniref:Thiol-disulfide isomerase/thioredoxin n=1 Tax=Jejuia pallidilutea TaxID=504487 RepID=A0A362XBK4_9FLAO|nr:TlpA disulfide reductase family protein [Jejuia pallidilutea]PQV47908.1 thiol-disulfide isomerase/thioredoxin [Jejuia pallidilutea]
MKAKSLITLFLLLPMFFFGQIRISETIKTSSIASETENALYFVDFWATWCGPCIAVAKQLSSLQRQYPKDFYIMSLTQENPDVVKRFMKKHNVDLAVAIDYKGETFSRYNISSLPYGVLFNAKGEKLWEGHPADFKTFHIEGYLSTNKQRISADKMFKLQSYKPVSIQKEVALKHDFEIIEADAPIANLQIVKTPEFLELTGSLKHIMAYANNVYKNQVNIPAKLNQIYRVRFKYNTEASKNKGATILKYLKLKQDSKLVHGELLFFNLSTSHFWDINQINWGNDTPNFLIGDSDIKADNVSLNQVNYQLANLLEIPIVTNNETIANELHDWEVHYKYFDLMASGLKDTYGIEIEKKISEYPEFIITKKTP